jgi:hypothetical protein
MQFPEIHEPPASTQISIERLLLLSDLATPDQTAAVIPRTINTSPTVITSAIFVFSAATPIATFYLPLER